MDDVFKALSDSNRRKILELLKKKDMTAGEINKHFKVSGPTLSHHLDVLKRARLVVAERRGQFMEYSLNTSVFEEMIRMFINKFGKK